MSSGASEGEPSQRGDRPVEEDVDEMEAARAGPEDAPVDGERGDRQRPVEAVVLTFDVPVGLDEQSGQAGERHDRRVVLDEPDVVQDEAVRKGPPVNEDRDRGAEKGPPRRCPRRHQKE